MSTTTNRTLDFYLQPGPMTSVGNHEDAIAALPDDLALIIQTVQGLVIHEHLAPYYGQQLSDERRMEAHIRPAASILDRLTERDGLPATAERPLERRIVGNCRDFSVLLVAMLRVKSIPARARCGFGGYFVPGRFEDHWVGEYWNEEQGRWIMVDAQLDAFQKKQLPIDFDPLDVPRDRFIIAGDAWEQSRTGQVDPEAFGIADLRGLWLVAGNVIRDLAALNNMEMLPWDCWGPMPASPDKFDDSQIALIDRIATATQAPVDNASTLRELYNGNLQVPETVFNAILNRPETI